MTPARDSTRPPLAAVSIESLLTESVDPSAPESSPPELELAAISEAAWPGQVPSIETASRILTGQESAAPSAAKVATQLFAKLSDNEKRSLTGAHESADSGVWRAATLTRFRLEVALADRPARGHAIDESELAGLLRDVDATIEVVRQATSGASWDLKPRFEQTLDIMVGLGTDLAMCRQWQRAVSVSFDWEKPIPLPEPKLATTSLPAERVEPWTRAILPMCFALAVAGAIAFHVHRESGRTPPAFTFPEVKLPAGFKQENTLGLVRHVRTADDRPPSEATLRELRAAAEASHRSLHTTGPTTFVLMPKTLADRSRK